MVKKKCFICGNPISLMDAHCTTSDHFLVCASDAKKICPKHHANKISVSMKTAMFISKHSSKELEEMLGITDPQTTYREDPISFKSKLYKLDEKLDVSNEQATFLMNKQKEHNL